MIQALSSQSWLASTINGNFFTVHVHNGLVRRKAILFFSLLQDVHRCKASLVLATSKAILSLWISICPRHSQLATNIEGEHCPLIYQKKNLFSLCFDTMLYGISCVCARAAHIDLVLVPCIGTSIDLEFSYRRCLQSKTAHWQASEVLQKIQKRSELCHQKSMPATRPVWVG